MARHPRLVGDVGSLADRFAEIRADLPVDFPADVLAAAASAVPDSDRVDLTDVPFVTVDPEGSTDLDQAMSLSRTSSGFAVDYAIADVPAFVPLGGPVDLEARRRGETVYCPDVRVPLHPVSLSEGSASLLPDVDRPAFVWRFQLSDGGSVVDTGLVRATVRSRRQLSYAQVSTDPSCAELRELLKDIGSARQALSLARGGANLPLPEQEVVRSGSSWSLALRAPLPEEDWNAELSLMTGMAAAGLMLDAGTGLLRTLPAPEPSVLQGFRARVVAIGVDWPESLSYGAFLRTLDPARPKHLAVLHAAGALFRGAGYAAFDGALPDQRTHAAVAAPYAHVTAPLRRLVDRFGLLCCWAAVSGTPVPAEVRAVLPSLPGLMESSDQRAGDVERRCLDAVEAAVLHDRVGSVFDGVVVSVDKDGQGGRVQLLDPPVLARCEGALTAGTAVRVRVTAADTEVQLALT